MNRDELSVLLAGKLLKREIAPTAVNAEDFISPYKEIVKRIQDRPDWDYNMLIQEIGYYPVDQAIMAAEKELSLPADWPQLLHEVAIRDEVGYKVEKLAKRLRQGEAVDPTTLMEQAYRLSGHSRNVVSMAEVQAESSPWQKSYWKPLDLFVGGYPKAELSVIGAPPGTGKTSLLIKLATCAAEGDKKVMLFSMEMRSPFLKYRMEQMKNISPLYKENILVCDDILTPYDVASVATLIPDDLWFIGIDFAERMILGDDERTEATVASVYHALSNMAKRLGVPVVLLSQLNRQYEGGLPQINQLRYSGMSEALAALVLLIYNKEAIMVAQSSGGALPVQKGKAYIIVGKSRYGNVIQMGGRFAIQVDWNGEKGWGDNGHVFPL